MTGGLAHPGGQDGPLRTDLRVLLLAGRPDDPTTDAWAAALARTGTPFDVHPASTAPLTAADLVHAGRPRHGRYGAVIAGTDSSAFWTSREVLAAYRRRFGVRQLRAYEFPRAEDGLAAAAGRPTGGTTARVSAAGREVLGYLRGTFPLAEGSYGYPTRVVDPARFTPFLLTPQQEVLAGVLRHDGLEDLLVLVDHDRWMPHGLLLARGFLGWVTRGHHLGADRHRFSCHVDDVFIANAAAREGEWVPGEAVETVRMSPADVAAVVAFQHRRGFTFDLVYNARGADAERDPLTASLLADRREFRWVNHTWSHRDLGHLTPQEAATADGWQVQGRDAEGWVGPQLLHEEITRNRDWGVAAGLDPDPGVLVTGAHSGLDNPHLPAALAGTGTTVIATDASRPRPGTAIGPAVAVPRHPTNVYTHVTTWAEQLAEHARHYPGAGARDREEFLAAESATVLRHVLTNDPSPTFAHQANLTAERPLLDLVARVLDEHARWVGDSAPLLSPSTGEVAVELRRRQRWRRALEAGLVHAHHEACAPGPGTVVVTAGTDLEVPLTVPAGSAATAAGLDAYAGSLSGWLPLAAGDELRVTLPRAAA
ncbi:hypothetical protein [Kineococcus glutinatus]|uniref:Polysaccharide deacetylase n=1 Tax=Kineococcus glutinatus TaxID=1070872 RepID=A0ABP9I8B5_9ACTN